MINYYDVLGCTRTATAEEIKRRYHELALRLHPDKTTQSDTSQDFQLLSKAWTILRDPAKREEHDRELARCEFEDSPEYCELTLEEMTRDRETYSYPCRCGGVYTLDVSDAAGVDEVRVGCDDCTFHIRIKMTR